MQRELMFERKDDDPFTFGGGSATRHRDCVRNVLVTTTLPHVLPALQRSNGNKRPRFLKLSLLYHLKTARNSSYSVELQACSSLNQVNTVHDSPLPSWSVEGFIHFSPIFIFILLAVLQSLPHHF